MKRKRIPTEEELDNIFEKFGLERRTVMPQEIPTNELNPHPRNELIYGQEENVSDLITLIEEAGGILVPLVINDKNIILSGHRRWLAAKKLNFKTVPYEVRTFESPEDELEFLLISNVSRMKTREQKAREGIVLEEVLSAKSAERRRAKLKQFQSVRDESSPTDEVDGDSGLKLSYRMKADIQSLQDNPDAVMGRTRDEVAKALKIGSGKQFDRMKAVVTRIDELKEQGKIEDAALYGVILNRAPSAAYDLLEVDLTELSDEDKATLKSGKVSPRLFTVVEKEKKEKARRETSYSSAMSQLKGIESQIKELTRDLHYVKDKKQKQKILERIEKQIQNLQSLLPATDSADLDENSKP